MTYPETDNSNGKTRTARKPNPEGHPTGSLPPGSPADHTRTGRKPNPGQRGGQGIPSTAGTGSTTNRTGSPVKPIPVESGVKIAHVKGP